MNERFEQKAAEAERLGEVGGLHHQRNFRSLLDGSNGCCGGLKHGHGDTNNTFNSLQKQNIQDGELTSPLSCKQRPPPPPVAYI
jgi:hypothetical protein